MYGYGYRYNSGLVVGAGGGAPFLNTYSLSFDGVDDYVSAPQPFLNSASVFSMSFWAKKVLASDDVLIGDKISTFQGAWVNWYTDGNVYFTCRTGGNITLVAALSFDTNWHHFLCTKNGTDAKIYVDGVLSAITPTDGTVASTLPATCGDNFRIGSLDASTFGNSTIDEVALWDSVIAIGDVWDGSGVPTDLTDLSPIAWYRMGDNGAYKSPQWLLPSNENKDKVSNYSTQFDGIDDYIDCGNSAALKPNIITVSCWIKGSTQTAFTRIISQDSPTGGADAYGFYVTTALNKVVFAIKTDVTGTVTSATSGVVLDNNWHHLVGTYDGSEVILYVDGVAVGSPSAGTSILSYGSGTLTIGCFSEPTSLPSYLFNGNIDEVSIFNSVIPIGDLWDGSGEPTTLPSGAVAHYKMGEEATFSGGVWTIPDAVGSNNGTSNAMTIEDRVGDAPNSENNALSYNMDEVDRVTDTP